jgi:hypothetical protein
VLELDEGEIWKNAVTMDLDGTIRFEQGIHAMMLHLGT